jgi:hypothetical protein
MQERPLLIQPKSKMEMIGGWIIEGASAFLKAIGFELPT